MQLPSGAIGQQVGHEGCHGGFWDNDGADSADLPSTHAPDRICAGRSDDDDPARVEFLKSLAARRQAKRAAAECN